MNSEPDLAQLRDFALGDNWPGCLALLAFEMFRTQGHLPVNQADAVSLCTWFKLVRWLQHYAYEWPDEVYQGLHLREIFAQPLFTVSWLVDQAAARALYAHIVALMASNAGTKIATDQMALFQEHV